MLSCYAARQHIFDNLPQIGTETVPLDEAAGRILRETVRAERDQPPFDRVTMDGIAIRFDVFAAGRREFSIAGTSHAGDAPATLADGGSCIEVMTGTVLPAGADTVIPVERIDIANGAARLEVDYAPSAGQFVHRRASDHAQGTVILSPGTRIAAVDVAVIASCGRATATVARGPVVRVISTGNELIPPGQPIADHQVRLSNGPSVGAMLRDACAADASYDHLPDDPGALESRLGSHLEEADALVLSGGVSMGKADYVPAVLEKLGVKKVFHRIAQRPGKPMWFGLGANGQPVFALPGNPVSSIVCCRQYVVPALLYASGVRNWPAESVSLATTLEFEPRLTCFMPVRLAAADDGRRVATPVPTNTSGDFAALSGTDGYVELAAEQTSFALGEVVPFVPWRAP